MTNVLKWFEHFHAHPEISWKEVETTHTIASILSDWAIPHRTFEDVTGLIAEIGSGED